MIKKPLVIIGLGKFAEIAMAYFNRYSQYEVACFASDKEFITNKKFYNLEVHDKDSLDSIFAKDEITLFVAIGYSKMNKIRQRVYGEFKELNYSFATFIHPSVEVWSNSKVGENCFIFENNILQPFTFIGDNTVIWSGNHIGHHASIGKNCFISSHVVVSGSCEIGDNCFLGVNSTIYDGVTVASENFIGPGSLIASNTKPKNVYISQTSKSFIKRSDEIDF